MASIEQARFSSGEKVRFAGVEARDGRLEAARSAALSEKQLDVHPLPKHETEQWLG